jgi:hypothetical protein
MPRRAASSDGLGEASGGSVAVFEFDVLAGAKLPIAHSHDGYEETIYDAKALAIVSPGILGPDYFREIAAVVQAAAGGPPDPAALAEVMRRHGLTPAP